MKFKLIKKNDQITIKTKSKKLNNDNVVYYLNNKYITIRYKDCASCAFYNIENCAKICSKIEKRLYKKGQENIPIAFEKIEEYELLFRSIPHAE